MNGFLFLIFIFVTGCSYLPARVSQPSYSPPVKEEEVLENLQQPKVRIPVEINANVQSWITYFTQTDRERFQRFLNRGQAYKDVVENTLEENDLPAELYYLAMIESGFRTDARSHAKAVGVWQFVSGTARRYGLRVDRYVDERKDPIRATEAAAKYLRDLYNVFGSWHLAMAAYNAGEIRVLRAVFKGRTRNFWDLVRAKVLPRETAEYVPKFLAVVLIGQNPEKYGFETGADIVSYPNLEAVEVAGSTTLKQIAQVAGLSGESLNHVNPHLKSNRVPPYEKYEIWIPEGSADLVKKWSLSQHSYTAPKRVIAQERSVAPSAFYRVRRGDNLIEIAKKHNLSLGHLMRMNKLKSSRILAGMRLRTRMREYEVSNLVRYKVKRGDNLSIIAHKFKTSVKKIKLSNRLKKNQILPGQVLKIEVANL